jgi:hypothetical protein
MVYSVSVLRSAPKVGYSLQKITEIPADEFVVDNDGSVSFYNISVNFWGRRTEHLVAALPPHTWIVSY